ncbi:branched-chain amino acid ABC transporter permease [Nocardioides sp. dk4132]|uniref:AzlC family ABC transporter permease n=1 Tax=unclassified Nocardioides TaxID=2615069 RepID=UPI001294E922|nr:MULTISPECIES: AzlC family ABC transporter permease [unclassified Nocardioides]MQW76561.1 branched-chain amino acid ABC transporter permease [Nocardioides sp. dk4132]QGA07181.1 branched-chain amino acid ABC transporter permease [Nocardioides sp. dk884]
MSRSDPTLPAPERTAIVRDSLGVGIATGAYGVSFGAVSVAAGLDVWQTCALSLLVFTGASQFALVGVVAGGGAPLAGTAAALLLGTRNTLYGLKVGPLLRWRGWRRALGAHLLIDESTAMSVGRDSVPAARLGFLTTGVSIFVLWNLFTLLGALAGTAIGDPATYGLDAAVGAAFLALLWPRLDSWHHRVVAVLAAAVALGAVPLTPAGVPVLAAGAVAVLAGLLRRPERPEAAS